MAQSEPNALKLTFNHPIEEIGWSMIADPNSTPSQRTMGHFLLRMAHDLHTTVYGKISNKMRRKIKNRQTRYAET